jgi:hypothetical protein
MADDTRTVTWRHLIVLTLLLAAVLLFVAGVVAAIYFGIQQYGWPAAAACAAVLALLLLLIRVQQERRRAQEKGLADKRREVYFELLDVLGPCFFSEDPVETAEKHKPELQKWSLRLALIGSDAVVRAWRDFYELVTGAVEDDEEEDEKDGEEPMDENAVGREEDDDEDRLFSAQVKLLAALRVDCGHLRSTLTRWDLADLLVDSGTE